MRFLYAFSPARSDPPLGSVPDFTLTHPVLRGVRERWIKGGGSQRLIGILRYAHAHGC